MNEIDDGAQMNRKMLMVLRIGASVAGWLLIYGILAGLLIQLNLYFHGRDVSSRFLESAAHFQIAGALRSFFSGLGNSFFAFLIAAVIRMIEKQAPAGKEMAARLMMVCCFSYIMETLAQFCTFALSMMEFFSSYAHSGWRFWLPLLSTAIPLFVPLLYAASIYVLYTHFARMVTFESEVA